MMQLYNYRIAKQNKTTIFFDLIIDILILMFDTGHNMYLALF